MRTLLRTGHFNKKEFMFGTVVVNQVPMLFTFDEAEAAYVIESLAYSIEQSYKILDFFTDRGYQEGEEW